MYYYLLFGWFVGFCCAMILIELLHDGAERKGGYNYYDDCWGEVPPAEFKPPVKPPKQPDWSLKNIL